MKITFEWIKQIFCRHGDFKVIEDSIWIIPGFFAGHYYNESRKFLCCQKCGLIKKISPK